MNKCQALPRPPSRNKRGWLLAALFFSVLVLVSPRLFAEGMSKEEVLEKYEKVITLAEELNVYQEDILDVVPKIRFANEQLLRNHFEKASTMLDEALWDLQRLEIQRPKRHLKMYRLEWLEIYLEVVQKYAFLALLAFFAAKLPFFRQAAKKGSLTLMGHFYWILLITASAVFLSVFDLKRYGDSAWVFLDFHIILVAIGGLLGGLWPGIICSLVVAFFRCLISTDLLISLGLMLAVGLLSGLFSTRLKHRESALRLFGYGMVVGTLHGMTVYLPMERILSWKYVLMSVSFLAITEGFAILLFFIVVKGILRAEGRRELGKELLKTQLLFLQAQINPHFLYNALNTIAEIYAKGRLEDGQKLILRLSDLLRRTVKRVDDKVTLREEMAHVESYIEIEKARFEERLTVETHYELREDQWQAKVPILILQPLVENAIKHGISKKKAGGTLRITIHAEPDALKVEITDDGAGMRKKTLEDLLKEERNGSRSGVGIRNIHQRVVGLWGPKYGLQFESELDHGTRVTVSIPHRVEHKKMPEERREVA